MTLIQSRDDRMVLAVEDAEIDAAKSLSLHLAQAGSPTAVEIVAPDGQKVPLNPSLVSLMQAVVDGIGKGAQITIQSVPKEVTTTTAAKMLGISRPTLMKLISDDKLPSHKVGSHTRLAASDVLAFREREREAQRRAFDELRELDAGLEMAP